MVRFLRNRRSLLLALIFAVFCARTPGDRDPVRPPVLMPFHNVMPSTVLWAWEEPENLSPAPANSVGVAYLAETIMLHDDSSAGPALTIRSRRQPLAVASGSAVMVVVRLIATNDFRDSPELRQQTAQALAQVAQHPGLRALQIDFDAARSQRPFYNAVLTALRPQMPPGMPLSITALLSWCAAPPGPDDWMANLPIDEAVPMFFRLGGNSHPDDNKSGYVLREPHCRGSVGVSTDESWPALVSSERVYLFAPHPWTALQMAALQKLPAVRATALQPNPASINLRVNDTGLHQRNEGDSPVTEKEDLP